MDFIDPTKSRHHSIRLMIGYMLLTVAIMLSTLILLYQAYGYSLGRGGQLIQNGLVFISTTPNPAQIYLNNKLSGSQTNTRLELAAGQYTVRLVRNGYRPWVRAIGVEGGSVEHFDYPFLFPTDLVTTTLQSFTASSQQDLIMQSPNRQWLLLGQPGSPLNFYQYDLTNPKQLASTLTTVTIPASVVTNSTDESQNWQLVEWSNDNRHVLLQHQYNGGSEYILFDRQTPADSVNLTKSLSLNPTTSLSLIDKKYDQYYLLDSSNNNLSSASLSTPQPTLVLSHVLAFKSYSTNVILYATDQAAPAGKVNLDVKDGASNFVIRQASANTKYLLDLTQYNGSWFVAAGGSSDNKVYIYKDPMSFLASQPGQPLVPVYILHVNQPNYLAFSDNTQFIMAENSSQFAVYDAENDKGYVYNLNMPLAANQHANWMDGDRLSLVINGKVIVFDYDDANLQSLVPATDNTTPFFDPAYGWMYVIAPSANSSVQTTAVKAGNGSGSGGGQVNKGTSVQGGDYLLTSTALRIPADQ